MVISLSLHPAQIYTRYERDPSHRRSILGDSMVLYPRLLTGISLSRSRLCSPMAALALPTAKPEQIASEKNLKWSARAIKSFGLGDVQARKMRLSKLGTESILLGILIDATSEGAKYLISKGITLEKAIKETKIINGELNWRDMCQFKLPLTESALCALDSALDLNLTSGGKGEVTVGHLILGIWGEKGCTGYKILEKLGFDNKNAQDMAKIAENDAAPSYR